jgi:hypothetical protein
MNIYFFFKNKSYHAFYDCTIEAWQENDNTFIEGKKVSSFTRLERLHIFISKHPQDKEERKKYHCAGIDHDFGTDCCMGHRAKNLKEFRKDLIETSHSGMTETNHRNFQRLKKAMLRIYNSYPSINYTEQLMKDSVACRILA